MIQLRNIEKYFEHGPTKTFVLRRINAEIKEGEFVSIMGPSGAGKSTLLHLLGMHDSAWTGEYYLAGSPDSQAQAKKDRMELYKKYFGFVFQSYHLLDSLTVYENLDIPLSYRNIKKAERDSIVCDVLDRFQIVGKKDLFPNQLSGGQQQLVAIARAIIASPKVILADEPTGNLHSSQGQEIMEVFKRLNEAGTTIIQVTHNGSERRLRPPRHQDRRRLDRHRLNRACQRRLNLRETERKSRAQRCFRHHPLAARQHLRHLSEQQLEREFRHRKNRRPVQRRRQLTRKFRIRHRPRSRSVHRPAHLAMLQRKSDHRHQIVQMNPAHPLLAAADSSSDADLERKHHLLKSPAAASQHYRDPHSHHAYSESFRRRRFPLPFLRHTTQKIIPRRRRLRQDLIPPRPVISDRRRTDQSLRRIRPHRLHQLASPVNPARPDPLFRRPRPSLRHRLSRQMNHRVASGEILRPNLAA